MRRSLKYLLLLPCYDYSSGKLHHNKTCVILRNASVDLRPFRTTQVIIRDNMPGTKASMLLK